VAKGQQKRINLALQGGGAHGAFTWGVLERFLEEERLEIAGISATSAGAMNGAALKAGLLQGGRAGARAKLAWFWERAGALDSPEALGWLSRASPASDVIAGAMALSPAYLWADALGKVVSPYDSGPFYAHPLRPLVEEMFCPEICASEGPAFFVSATNVRSGKIRLFEGDDITPDALLASACLPTLFRAVEIVDRTTGETEAYWDGGYMGNPALFPLFGPDLPADIVVVSINPLRREELPRTTREILNRVNEISFNSSLLRELRAITFVKRLLASGALQQGSMRDVLVHMISDDALMTQLGVATKLLANPVILHRLREAGRAAAERFLALHWDDLGQRSSVDLQALYS